MQSLMQVDGFHHAFAQLQFCPLFFIHKALVNKVRSIQNAIFLTGRTGSMCSRERSATENASPSWMSFITRFSYGEIAFQGIVNLKTCREIEIETERLDDMLVIRKKEPKKG